MSEAKNGSLVKVHYTGKLDDGTQFDSSAGGNPLEFTVGKGEVIPGFEEAIVGMNVGDKKTVEISPEQAYGDHRDDRVLQMEKEKLPDNIDPQVGIRLQAKQPDDSVITFTVTDVSKDTVTLDANHPLAGKNLVFDIELVDVQSMQS